MPLLTATISHIWTVLAQSLIIGLGLTLLARITVAVLRVTSAATRFAVWFTTLIAVAALPPVLVFSVRVPDLLHSLSAKQPPVYSQTSQPVTQHTFVAATASSSIAVHAPLNSYTGPSIRHSIASDAAKIWSPANFFVSIDATLGFVTAYVVVAALLLIRLSVGYFRLRYVKAHTWQAPPELLARLENWLAQCKTARPVRLVLSSKMQSPIAVGFLQPAVIMPDSLLLQLTGEEIDYLGLHELAHLHRYDDWTNLIQRTIQAALFFHPAVYWLCRKLDFEREVACDDWVLMLTGSAQPYARSLAKVLEATAFQRRPLLASGAAFRKKQILRRVEMMLDRSRNVKPRLSFVTLSIILVCVAGAFSKFIQMPSVVTFTTEVSGQIHRSIWNANGHKITFQTSGNVEFGDDDAVRSISPGGYLKLSESGRATQELELHSGESKQLDARYLVNGQEYPMDDQAHQWATSILSYVIRENGINAEARVTRILTKRGVSGVFEEIDQIASDGSRRKYLTTLIQSGKLNLEDLKRAASRASHISSDHDKSELLLEVGNFYRSDSLRQSYFDALNTIHSDGDRRRVLTEVVEKADNDSKVLDAVGHSVEQMSSDHDKAEILQLPAIHSAVADPTALHSLVSAAASIHSDNDKANVLTGFLNSGVLSANMLEQILHVTAGIQADHDKAEVLKTFVRQDGNQLSPQANFFAAVNTIHADNEHADVLGIFVDRDFSGAIPDDLARSVEKISSDHDKASTLIKLAAKPATPALANAIRSIHSDSDKRDVIQAMLERNTSPETAKSVIELAFTMGSDHDRAEVLKAVAVKHGSNPEMCNLIQKAAEKISSDTEYRHIVSNLFATSVIHSEAQVSPK